MDISARIALAFLALALGWYLGRHVAHIGEKAQNLDFKSPKTIISTLLWIIAILFLIFADFSNELFYLKIALIALVIIFWKQAIYYTLVGTWKLVLFIFRIHGH